MILFGQHCLERDLKWAGPVDRNPQEPPEMRPKTAVSQTRRTSED
jgi:hypothetical protein